MLDISLASRRHSGNDPRDIQIIQWEIPLDLIEFFILTPLPGSEDHRALVKRGVRLEQDTNQYNVCHVTVDHPLMTRSELYHAFRAAWRQYYSAAHVKTMSCALG